MSTPLRRSDADANVKRIIAAAREVFEEHGDSATLSQVAQAAGVANATLYRHFANRKALAAAVYKDILAREIKPAALSWSGRAGRKDFLDALDHLETAMAAHRPLLASLEDLATLTERLMLEERERLDKIVAQLKARGEIRADLTATDIIAFVTMVTTASVAMNQPRHQRRRYLHLVFDAFNPTGAQPLPPVGTAQN